MILDIIVKPKAFYTSSTDLTVRSWVYEFEDATNVFRHHQHSVGALAVIGDTCKLGQSVLNTARKYSAGLLKPRTSLLSHFDRLPLLWVILL